MPVNADIKPTMKWAFYSIWALVALAVVVSFIAKALEGQFFLIGYAVATLLLVSLFKIIQSLYSGSSEEKRKKRVSFWLGWLIFPASLFLIKRSINILITGEYALDLTERRGKRFASMMNTVGDQFGYLGPVLIFLILGLLALYGSCMLWKGRA